MKELNDYEKNELAEIEKWANEEPGVVGKTVGVLLEPLVWTAQKAIPQAAIEGALTATNKAAEMLSDTSDIIRDGKVDSIEDLRTKDLQLSDQLADTVHNWAIGVAMAEGAGTGVVGLPGLVADIPLLITWSLRTINKIGLCYGYESKTEADRRFVLGIMAAAGSNTMKEKAAAMALLRQIQVALIQKTWKVLAEEAAAKKLGEAALIMAIKQLAKQLGVNITKRAALKIIPVVGGVVGGAVNGAFIRDIGWAARRSFQKRWLMENKKIPLER